MAKKTRMKFTDIAQRITGFSCPVFGVQWNPPEAERAVARRTIRFLEDRRVLYVPYDAEMPDYCTHSVLQIREMLTKELSALEDENSSLFHRLKAMRAACRRFLERTQFDGEDGRGRPRRFHRHPYDIEGQTFFTSLGELRAAFGLNTALIATQYGIDVESDLAELLPEIDEDRTFPNI